LLLLPCFELLGSCDSSPDWEFCAFGSWLSGEQWFFLPKSWNFGQCSPARDFKTGLPTKSGRAGFAGCGLNLADYQIGED